MNSHEVFIHIHQGCFAGTGAIVRLPQCQWSKPDGYGKISQCITTTKHSKAKTVCMFLGVYCMVIPKNIPKFNHSHISPSKWRHCEIIIDIGFLNYLTYTTQLFWKVFLTQLTRFCIWHIINLIKVIGTWFAKLTYDIIYTYLRL